MGTEEAGPPVIKRRTRIKVNKVPLPQSTDLEAIVSNQENDSCNHESESGAPLVENNSRELSNFDEEDDKKIITADVDRIILSDSDSSSNGDVVIDYKSKTAPQDVPAPVPAPRTRRNFTSPPKQPERVEEAVQCSPVIVTPSAPPVASKSKKESKVKERKKKRKAAEVISSVLKRESKKSTNVATVLQDVEKELQNEKSDIVDDLGSPWDSPPPPQALQKVYVQHKHGFSVRDWAELFSKSDNSQEQERSKSLTDVAIVFHTLWTRLMTFSHGTVAGLACCHTLAVAAALASTQYDVPKFVQFYHFLSLKIYWAVYVFNTLCIVSCFDRLDIGAMTKSNMVAIGHRNGNLLVTLGYMISMALSLAAHRHTAAIEVYHSNPQLWSAQGLHEWHWLVTIRDVILLLTWIFISFSAHYDLLEDKLEAISKQKQPSNLWNFQFKI